MLRQLKHKDWKAIFSLRSDTEINKFLHRKPAETPDDAKQFINKVNENINKNTAIYWAISFRDTKELMGTICLFEFSDKDEKCEIGYELLTDFQRQGIMQEAVEKVIDYAFIIMKVQKIEAFFHKDHLRSAKLLEKCCFINSNMYDKTDTDLLRYYLKNPNQDRE